MKKIALFICIVIAGVYSCSDDKGWMRPDQMMPEEKTLEISTRILTPRQAGFVQLFDEGTEIGLHICSDEKGEIYEESRRYNNVKAVSFYENGRLHWRQIPPVSLHQKVATVYAYSPYKGDDYLDVTHIPIHICRDAEQTKEYMYGTQAIGQKTVSCLSPMVMLHMHHALSLLSFEVRLAHNTKGLYDLQAIEVRNKKGGNRLALEGEMNITTGEIIGKTTTPSLSTQLILPESLPLSSRFTAPQKIKVIPTHQPVGNGDIEIAFTINNGTYIYKIPANTQWKKGYVYNYQLCFNGQKMGLCSIMDESWKPEKRHGRH